MSRRQKIRPHGGEGQAHASAGGGARNVAAGNPAVDMNRLLRQRERELLEAHRIARLGTWRWILATDTVIWSEEVYRAFGRDPNLPPPSYAEHPETFTPESWARLNQAVAGAIETGAPYALDLEIKPPSGPNRWITVRGEVEAYENGKVSHLRGTMQEITERKRAEAELAISESRYRSLIVASTNIVWTASTDGNSFGDFPEWSAFTGQTHEEMQGYGWLNAIHPDDREASLRAWKAAIRADAVMENEERLRRHDGVYRHMAVRAVPVRDSAGRTVEWVGTHTDITERKEAEALRRRAEFSGLAELVLAGSPAATIVTDGDGVISYLNPAAEKLLLWKKADIIGRRTPLFLFHDSELARRASTLSQEFSVDIPPDLAVLTARARRGLLDEAEWTLRRANGAQFDAHLTVSPLKYPSGETAGWILVASDITDRKRNAEYIFHLAHHDALTGLPTRRLLNDRIEELLRSRGHSGEKLAILMVDLDNFKHINDLLGHQSGDELIVHVGGCLRRSLRSSDLVARVGGDEFIVLLEHVQSTASAERVARKLVEALRTPIVIGGQSITPAASIGVSVFPDSGGTAETLMKNADAAMYRVKAEGGNNFMAFTEELASAMSRKRRVELALKQALARNEFRLVYQPQISFTTGKVTGVEALLRWQSEELGAVAPAEFIPAAESCGLIVPMGEWVIRTACRQGRQLQKTLGRDLIIALNISPRQLEERDLAKFIQQTLADSGLPRNTLELEMTETLLVKDSSKALNIFRALRSRGVRIAIDDFCTGFCSLSYMTRFPIDRLKIDKSFVSNMNSPSGGAVIAAIVALAKSLQISAVAEGIESAEQHKVLGAMGCSAGQGFWYARPMAAESLPARIRELEGAAEPVSA